MLKLLFIEDEEYGRSFVEWFRDEGWGGEWAPNPESGMEDLHSSLSSGRLFDAVVLDRKMGLEGNEGDRLLRWIRDRQEFDYVCVVMLTGYGSVSSAAECMRMGADHYLEKPLETNEDLRDVLIAGILGRRCRQLRHAVVFGESSAEESLTAIFDTIRSVPATMNATLHVAREDGSMRTLGAGEKTVAGRTRRPRHFVEAVLKTRRPFTALDAADARRAGALQRAAQGLIAVPVSSEAGRPFGVLSIESAVSDALKRYWLDPMEQFGQVLGIASDLAEKRVLSQKRDQAAAAVLALNEIRHKLSTPVQAIEWKLEELRQEGRANPVRNELGVISRNVSTIRNVCYQLNDETSEFHIEHMEFDVMEFVMDYVEEFRSEAELKGINLAIEKIPLIAGTAIGDRRWLGYSLQCLLRNAIEAIEAKRRARVSRRSTEREAITVRVRTPGRKPGRVSISVQDTGPGIPEKDHLRVFQPLFSTKNKRPQGSGVGGIGLYSVLRILTQHGGIATFESKSGRGATFHLTWPTK